MVTFPDSSNSCSRVSKVSKDYTQWQLFEAMQKMLLPTPDDMIGLTNLGRALENFRMISGASQTLKKTFSASLAPIF